ncbi:hypothetical protein CRG98_013559 [Punica granatum]|uniref:Terpene synthase metal-binding domain-containing protein n=1 Tax=Punica granatum TaxID=22663 RepID=A0A2I0KC00_PUNGR|nr:hypothetical protein CRG98_013559 [Punica granatum]
MDDIYDAYGTPEELNLLTDSIERWQRGVIGQLPEYMQVFYNALLDIFDEIEEKLIDEEGKSDRLFYTKEAFEQERGHVASAVECFMKQQCVTEKLAKEEPWKEVDDAWKDINEGCLHPHPVPEPFLTRVLNLSRVIDVVYKDNKDRYTHPNLELKQFVASLRVDPVPL